MTDERFSWAPLYQELADKLLAWEDRQPELIALLEQIREKGFKVTPLNDRDESGERFLVKEIDPFTFFGTFNRGIREEHRIGILTEVRKHLECEAPLPADFHGIPILNNQQSWFIGYQFRRKREDVARLWRVFRLALSNDPMGQDEFREAFDQALTVRGVNVNLTMGLFWIRPKQFISLDGTNRSYLGLDLKPGLSFQFYDETLKSIRERDERSFPEISYAAYLATTAENEKDAPEKKVVVSEQESYWFVGAYWADREPKDQTQEFTDEGVWKNGYTDRYLDDVKQMKVGERIAIKAVSTQKKNLPFDSQGNTVSRMTIKAIGTIVANRGDGRTVEVEWDNSFEPKEWYFFTYQHTIWRLTLSEDYENKELARRLIEFAFGDAEQDYEWFCDRWYGSEDQPPIPTEDTPEPYSIEDILAEGAFLSESELSRTLDRLATKKNLILQGAPGVGKTFLARRLGFALMEEKAKERIEFVQFHQSYSYEDFVRGFRPVADQAGTFALQDGVFFRFCEKAKDDPDRPYVFIIDEINRGNLSQIFGELLMLIEADKRGPEFNLPLMYPSDETERFHVPANLHLIGLMNLADRSLALVDYALRRRFAFMTLEPQYTSKVYRKWLLDRGMIESLVDLIVSRMAALNDEIASDELLGINYRVGHSFFCPKGDNFEALDREWYTAIIETEIVPLLNEYWFDNPGRADQARQRLLAL